MKMPLIWRYLLSGYLRTFFLCVFSFIAILLVFQFKTIARFAALSSDFLQTARFAACQLPLFLPLAFAISSLIAALLLMHRLSQTHELMALRTFGFSLKALFAPLFFASMFLTLAAFSISADIVPLCYRSSKQMLYHETTTNPLLLFQRQQLVKLKHAYLKMSVEEEGKTAKDTLLIAYNESSKRLICFDALELCMSSDDLVGQNLAIISHLEGKEEGFDRLIIENQAAMSMKAPQLSQFLKKKEPKLEANALPFRQIIDRLSMPRKVKSSALVELGRRTSLSLSVFTFALLGFAFGIETGRNPSKKQLLWVLFLATLQLIAIFASREYKHLPHLILPVFLLPHLVIWAISSLRLNAITRGLS